MKNLVLTNSITLDGVMQAPGRPDEDRRGGFEHGGWAIPYNDEGMGRVMGEGMAEGSVTTTTGVLIATYQPADESSRSSS